MKVYLNSVTGIDDALVALLMSKRTWTPDKEKEIRDLVERVTYRNGKIREDVSEEDLELFNKKLNVLVKIAAKHITLGRYIDMSVTVEGLHRAGQDDWDSHAMRYCNRIVRSSTRLARFGNEKSDFYKDKIMTDGDMLKYLGVELPESVEVNNKKYVKAVNGYVLEEYKDDNDVLRGLYMLSIPSNFEFKVSLTEFAHVYKQRNEKGTANPEVKLLCENIADELESLYSQFNRDLLLQIEN